MIILQRDAPLLLVVHTLHSPSRLARRLRRREKKPDQNSDNRDHDQQLDQRETAPSPRLSHLTQLLYFLLSIILSQIRQIRAKMQIAFHYTGKTRRQKRGDAMPTNFIMLQKTSKYPRNSALFTYLTQILKRGVEKNQKIRPRRKKRWKINGVSVIIEEKIARALPASERRAILAFSKFSFYGAFYERLFRDRRRDFRR